MKKLKPRRNVTLNLDGKDKALGAGKTYIVPDSLVDMLYSQNPSVKGDFPVENFVNEKTVTKAVDYSGKRLLVCRSGGRGDFFFIIRTLQEIKKKYDNVHITFACGSRYEKMLEEFFPGTIDKVISFPIRYGDYNNCDYMFTFENLVEFNPIGRITNAYVLMNSRFGVDLDGGHTVEFEVPAHLDKSAKEYFSKQKRPVIGVQVKASAVLRTWPYPYLFDLCVALDSKGYDVLFLDKPSNIEEAMQSTKSTPKNIILPYIGGFGSFELSVAMARYCKLILCPDSIFTYIGDSFDIPTICIYGPFSSQLRAEKLNVVAVETPHGCYNCCEHTANPCSKSRDMWSPCLKAINPGIIFELIMRMLDDREANSKKL